MYRLIIIITTILFLTYFFSNCTRLKAEKTQCENVITSSVIVDKYIASELEADKYFKNKVLCVKGIVCNVGQDLKNNTFLELKSKDELVTVRCFINKKFVLGLEKGANVTVKGECEGLKIIDIVVKKCVLIKKEPM